MIFLQILAQLQDEPTEIASHTMEKLPSLLHQNIDDAQMPGGMVMGQNLVQFLLLISP